MSYLQQAESLSVSSKPTYQELRKRVRDLEAVEVALKRTRNALFHERNLFKDLVASQPVGVYRVRVKVMRVRGEDAKIRRVWKNLKIELASDNFCRILGVTKAQCEADTMVVVNRIHPDDAADFTKRNVESVETLRPFRWEGRILDQGLVRWVQFMSVPRPLKAGFATWTGIVMDITDRKQAEFAVQESEFRYRSLFEQAADSIVVFDPETAAILDFNDAACQHLGYTREEFARLRICDIDVNERLDEVRGHSQRVVTEGEISFETQQRMKSGVIIDVEVRPKAICIGGKTVIQALWHDITERKSMEAELRTGNAELERRVQERTSRLRSLAAELTQAEQRERRRIAHVLHEDLQQRLVAMQYKLHGLKETRGGGVIDPKVNGLLNELTDAIEITRTLTSRISPPILYQLGFRSVLDWLAKDMMTQFGLTVTVFGRKSVELRSDEIKVFAFDAIRELLLNVNKHAGVRQAEIRIRSAGIGHVAVDVVDHGRGGVEVHRSSSSFGLFSIRERAAAMGAEFSVSMGAGSGTFATLVLPTR